MKKLSITVLGLVITLLACKKDGDNDYAGTWDFKSSEGQFDTAFAITISDGGDFTYQMMISTTQATLSGSVEDNGSVSAKINSSGLTVGTMIGKLTTSGSGSGNYYILNDTIGWTASKR